MYSGDARCRCRLLILCTVGFILLFSGPHMTPFGFLGTPDKIGYVVAGCEVALQNANPYDTLEQHNSLPRFLSLCGGFRCRQ